MSLKQEIPIVLISNIRERSFILVSGGRAGLQASTKKFHDPEKKVKNAS